MKKEFKARLVKLDEAHDRAFDVARQITDAGHQFDLVIAVARGGLPPARFLCDHLAIREVTSLQLKHYSAGAAQEETVDILDEIRGNIEGKDILVVDDVNDTGVTLEACSEYLRGFEPATLNFAVLHEKSDTGFKADFVGETLQEWVWLTYQWAATEDIQAFLDKAGLRDASEDSMLDYLNSIFEREFPRDLLTKVLALNGNPVHSGKDRGS